MPKESHNIEFSTQLPIKKCHRSLQANQEMMIVAIYIKHKLITITF